MSTLTPIRRRSTPRRARSVPATSTRPRAGALEPWRDWVVVLLVNHGLLLTMALLRPAWPWLLLGALPLGVGFATGTLTILHDAGHRRFSRRPAPNVFAAQTAVPVGLWVAHWTLKHRVHHRVSQVYPLDDATRSSGMVRLHPSAPRWRVHRFQHVYAWFLYALAWAGELRSQLTYLRTGVVAGTDTPGAAARAASFALEKACWVLVLLPYALLMGVARLALLLLFSMTLASLFAAVILVVGHINRGLRPTDVAPEGGREWTAHLVRTTASFSTESLAMRLLTGGMTHHLAHHLRPVAPRGELPALHKTVVPAAVQLSRAPLVEYPTLISAVRGHWWQLREFGKPEPSVSR
jgi:linoleoyl-CoA desaturase